MNLTSRPPPLGLAHFTVLEVAPLDLVGLAARLGYVAIGLRLHPAFPGGVAYELPAGSDASREMRHRLQGEGIHVYDIEVVTIDATFSAPSLTRLFEDAAALGAKRLSVSADDSDWNRFIGNFGALCDLAHQFAMGIDLECMAWRSIASIGAAVRAVDAVARPNAGVLVDALHLTRTGGSPEDLRDIPPELIRSAQLCDARADPPVGTEAIIAEARSQRLPPGRGHLPLRQLVAALPEHAVLSVEVPMGDAPPAEVRARIIFDATRELFESCRAGGDEAAVTTRGTPPQQ